MPTVKIALIALILCVKTLIQAPGTHDGQPGGRKRLAARNSDATSKNCADSVCECRSKRTAPTMGSPATGSVWPPGIRMPMVKSALIVCVNAGASAQHPRWAVRRQEASGRQEVAGCCWQEASGHQEFGCQRQILR
tara:strand:+ start:337 stop:744 length:408 start_codon:yes stop_codon:yes gene_type:complete